MRYMNRNLLTQFLKSAITAGLSSASLSFSDLAVIENNDENWADEFIDEEVKKILSVR